MLKLEINTRNRVFKFGDRRLRAAWLLFSGWSWQDWWRWGQKEKEKNIFALHRNQICPKFLLLWLRDLPATIQATCLPWQVMVALHGTAWHCMELTLLPSLQGMPWSLQNDPRPSCFHLPGRPLYLIFQSLETVAARWLPLLRHTTNHILDIPEAIGCCKSQPWSLIHHPKPLDACKVWMFLE